MPMADTATMRRRNGLINSKPMKDKPEDKDSNIERLDDFRPHVLIVGPDATSYIVPVILIEDIIRGRNKLSHMEDWEFVIKLILAEWLEFKKR